ncbi:LPXTG cell wall anchor domain-containing protein [Leuconostoc citreum]
MPQQLGVPFSETQPVDLVLQAENNESVTKTDESKGDAPVQTLGHDVPLTAQLSSTSKLPNTATNETTTAPLLAALVSGVLALGIWFKKVLR